MCNAKAPIHCYCPYCGFVITWADVEAGKATRMKRTWYHEECAKEARTKNPEPRHTEEVTL